MAIFNISGSQITDICDKNAKALATAYNQKGADLSKIPRDPYRKGRLLVFEDDFLGNDLNPDNWERESGHPRGPSYEGTRRRNVTVQDSMLVITIRKENYYNYTWSVGGVVSRGKQKWALGRLEAKMKLTEAFNSAFWLLGANTLEPFTDDDGTTDYPTTRRGIDSIKSWPACGELDIVESINYTQKSRPQCNLWGGKTGKSLGYGTFPNTIDVVNTWHTYALEKTTEYIAAYIDDLEYYRWTFADLDPEEIEAFADKAFNILLTIGISSESDFDRGITETSMYVDWVRVYAPEGITDAVKDASIQTEENISLRKGYKTCLPTVIYPVNTSDMTVKWVSDDTSIVRCGTGSETENGYIFAEELGETNVHAITSNRNMATVHVTVVPPDNT